MITEVQHRTNTQLKARLVDAPDTTAVVARGTGKTEILYQERCLDQALQMPRSLVVLQGQSYKQLLRYTLPKVVKGWERRGYKRNLHYFVGGAPNSWNWNRPYTDPLSNDNIIHWYTGTIFMLLSQDGVADGNGLDVDGINIDEGRYIDKSKLEDQVYATNRGNTKYFNDCHLHHGILTVSDMPLTAEGAWLFEAENHVDKKRVDLVLQMEFQISMLWEKYLNSSNKSERISLQNQIDKWRKKANFVRKGDGRNIPKMSYYLEGSSLDNIDVLGVEYIRQQKRKMSDYQFGISILGKRPEKVEGGFYQGLIEKDFTDGGHLYNGYNNAYLRDNYFSQYGSESIGNNCKELAYLNEYKPIELAVDWGGNFNCMSIGQEDESAFRYLRDLFTDDGESLPELAAKFAKYFEPQKTKVYVHHFDHTAVGSDGIRMPYIDEFEKLMKGYGWTCKREYHGQAPFHDEKYLLWRMAFAKDERMPNVIFDRDMTRTLRKSMQDAPIKKNEDGFEKDKSSERKKDKNNNPIIPYRFQTHLSDSADQLLWGKFGKLILRNRHSTIKNEIRSRH